MGTDGLSRARERNRFAFPSGYGDNKIVLLARDPWWIFAYWEIRSDAEQEALNRIQSRGESRSRSILRVYDVTGVKFDGKNAHSSFDVELKGLASNWYVNTGSPGRTWLVEIGILSDKGGFYPLARSNMVSTPRFGMSDEFDSEWMMPDEEYWKMFGLSGGFGTGKGSLESREMIKKRIEEHITSGGISSAASFHRRPAEKKP